jgi:hypothetical protein
MFGPENQPTKNHRKRESERRNFRGGAPLGGRRCTQHRPVPPNKTERERGERREAPWHRTLQAVPHERAERDRAAARCGHRSWESARLLLVRSHRADHGQREEPREGLHSREKIEPWQEKTNGGLEIEERARTGHCCSKNRSLEFTEEQQQVLTNWLSLHWS